MKLSDKTAHFTESVIREMTRLCNLHKGVNLAQGFPDFPAPEAIKEAAVRAIRDDINQYAITWGAPSLRRAIAEKADWHNGIEVDPERNVTVTCGSTEAMIATLLALINPGDEVIVFEPFYENYAPDAILSGATPRFVTLHEPNLGNDDAEWFLDEEELRAAFNRRTKAIIINTPNNPTGKVFSREELELIASLCHYWDVVAITDEIYEHILYDGSEHVSIASLDGMAERTVTINAISKSYSLTGWRVGWAIAAEPITAAIRKVHDFLTVGAAAPLQEAAAEALRMGHDYYEKLASMYREKRDFTMAMLREAGFRCFLPRGAYYIMTDISGLLERLPRLDNDLDLARYLVEEIGIAAVPGSSFYSSPEMGKQKLRFCFCKTGDTLHEASQRLRRL
jgi:aminotransferase